MKVIEKILDKYYMKKLVDEIKFTLKYYCLDFEYKYEKNGFLINVKKKKYKDYTTIIKIDKKYCLSYLCDYGNFIDNLTKYINEYIENERNK